MKNGPMNRRLFAVATVAAATGLFLGQRQAAADPITLANPNFDADAITQNGGGYQDTAITGWNATEYQYGFQELISGQYITPNTAPNSVDLLATYGGVTSTLSQTTGHTIAAGDQYTVSFYAGLRSGLTTIPVSAQLTAANTGDVLGTFTVDPSTLQASTLTQQTSPAGTFTIPSSDIGQPLALSFIGGAGSDYSSQVTIDTVSLDVSAVPAPEPASLGLAGMAAMGLLARRRHAAK